MPVVRLKSRVLRGRCRRVLRSMVEERAQEVFEGLLAKVGVGGLVVCDKKAGAFRTVEGEELHLLVEQPPAAPVEPEPEPEPELEPEPEPEEEPSFKKMRGDGGFCCGICGKVLKTEKGILRHIEDKH